MPQLVHVIAPDGTRHEREFPDGVPGEVIVSHLRRPEVAALIGYSRTVVKRDAVFDKDVPHADRNGPLVVDDPLTVICVIEPDGRGGAVEVRRLAGPPAGA